MSGSPFNNRETATIIAALRMVQRSPGMPFEVHEIATNGGEFDMLNAEEIDDLCIMVNTL